MLSALRLSVLANLCSSLFMPFSLFLSFRLKAEHSFYWIFIIVTLSYTFGDVLLIRILHGIESSYAIAKLKYILKNNSFYPMKRVWTRTMDCSILIEMTIVLMALSENGARAISIFGTNDYHSACYTQPFP